MIVIPMLGRSSRFFDAGYSVPKYRLPLGDETVFARSVRSFERQFDTTPFLFLVRADHDARSFVDREIERLGIRHHRVIEFSDETRGQAESVLLGTAECDGDEPLVIFNVDTIRHDFVWPSPERFGDGFIEVFHAAGDEWSFVEPEPGPGARVRRTTEKQRISNLCSNGLYGFARLQDFRDAFADYLGAGHRVRGEYYVAPLYNSLIARGGDIRYHLIDAACIDHCGVPRDYERLVARLASIAA